MLSLAFRQGPAPAVDVLCVAALLSAQCSSTLSKNNPKLLFLFVTNID